MMRNSMSLPSIFSQTKLFSSPQQLQAAQYQLKTRIQEDNKNQTEEKKTSRALIHFQDKGQGFTSFKSLNSSRIDDIMNSLKIMRSNSTNIGRSIKAQILFNKNQYAKITKYCQNRKKTERQNAINRLSKLQPLPMKKQVKMTDRNKKKIKIVNVLKTQINYQVYQNNRLAWKPFIDFDAMNVIVNQKVYFIGGRKPFALCCYDRQQDKWEQMDCIENLKPFGQSEGTQISKDQVAFFGGSKFFTVGQSQTTNNLTIVNVKTLKAEIKYFEELIVTPRCFHSQCIYGQYLLISGGVDKRNALLNKFTAYHLQKKYWVELTIAKMHDKLKEGFAKHKMMPILLPRKKYNIYEEQPIIASETQRNQISHEGIYLFGGEDPNVQLSNKLYILTVGKPSIEVYEPTIKGTPPIPRKNFDWAKVRQYLFIHGGRNDERRPWVLNSIVCLNLQTMNWITVKGQKPSYRFSHSILGREDQIVIVGGKNMQGLTKQIYPIKFSELIEYI